MLMFACNVQSTWNIFFVLHNSCALALANPGPGRKNSLVNAKQRTWAATIHRGLNFSKDLEALAPGDPSSYTQCTIAGLRT